MPTWETTPQFDREYRALSAARRMAFLQAKTEFVDCLKRGHFEPRLRVKRVQRDRRVWEMTWAADGRALFRYAPSRGHGPHVIWLRIGTHRQLGL
jgi:hypothetical protein